MREAGIQLRTSLLNNVKKSTRGYTFTALQKLNVELLERMEELKSAQVTLLSLIRASRLSRLRQSDYMYMLLSDVCNNIGHLTDVIDWLAEVDVHLSLAQVSSEQVCVAS